MHAPSNKNGKEKNKNYQLIKLTSFIIIFALSVLISYLNNRTILNRYKVYTVTSNSMEPTIQKGSVIIVDSLDKNIVPNKIVTFKNPFDFRKSITHRILSHVDEENYDYWETYGDNNKTKDPYKVTNDLIIGTYVFNIPFLGYIVDFTKTPTGLLLIIIIPSLILIYVELNHLMKCIKERKEGWQ